METNYFNTFCLYQAIRIYFVLKECYLFVNEISRTNLKIIKISRAACWPPVI